MNILKSSLILIKSFAVFLKISNKNNIQDDDVLRHNDQHLGILFILFILKWSKVNNRRTPFNLTDIINNSV